MVFRRNKDLPRISCSNPCTNATVGILKNQLLEQLFSSHSPLVQVLGIINMDKSPIIAVLRDGKDESPFNIYVIIISVVFVHQKGKRNNRDVRRLLNVTLAQELSPTEEISDFSFHRDGWRKIGVVADFVWGEGSWEVGINSGQCWVLYGCEL